LRVVVQGEDEYPWSLLDLDTWTVFAELSELED
jgi:hypothetical protein